MGNAGSAHNLQNACIQSELNLCYTQQYLRRTTGDSKNKTQTVSGGWSSGKSVADCKVLPKSTENLKLRATTNGAILQAGGTISFRAKEAAERKTELSSFHPMRRCHTLILDGQNDTISKRKFAASLTKFRRSQTLLFADYNNRKSPENVSENFDYTLQPISQNTSSSSTLKVNKYNKKRKAPPAPTKNIPNEDVASPAQNQLLLNDSKNPTLAKPRIYATNNSRAPTAQKQFQSPAKKNTLLQRDANEGASLNSQIIQHASSAYASKLPYRREKSCDAKNLRQKKANDCSATGAPTQTAKKLFSSSHIKESLHNSGDNAHSDNEKMKLGRQQGGGVATNKDIPDPNITEYSAYSDERKLKLSQSRIPQLKRTFYFGMDSANKSVNLPSILPIPKVPTKVNETMLEENDTSIELNHKLDAEEEILDNGILVHVRPTLPRRQHETPSFSPAAAWRNLLEEQQHLELERSKPKKNSPDQRILETPICLKPIAKENYPCAADNWTPLQDLDDDDDEEGKEVKNANNFSNSLHIFSLSLPRDVHLQSEAKSSMKYTARENNLKPANCWFVPGFNSLQKLKTQLGNPTEFRSNNKCTCASHTTNTRHSHQLENSSGDSLALQSKSYHQPYCELSKTSSQLTRYQNNNWLLHKTKVKDPPAVDTSKILGDSCPNPSSNYLSFINLQPKSLSNICSGKHIVYLPGQDALNSSSIKDSYKNAKQNKTNKSNYKRQRQRQANVRESLQDLTPIPNIHQSNVSTTEKIAHRFSFQSTVRVLEKRRLAEKLSKDAEMQEAQRINELEVMKRVEEDFQRKRAPEKANIRKQLRLHLKGSPENTEYRSLPLNINEKFHSQHDHTQQMYDDNNNNIFCRAEPDGAVSPSAELNGDLPKIRHSNFLLSSTTKTSNDLDGFAYDGGESESEIQLPDLQCTALLIEPYLNSII